MREPWASTWIAGKSLRGGKQCDTRLARRASEDAWNYVLKVQRNPSPKPRKRLRIEVSALRVLQDHPGISRIVDHNADTDEGPLYVVSDFVQGADLNSLVASGPLPLHRAVQVVKGVFEILDHCHQLTVVHRDVKPAHVILRPDNQVVLIDFGLAFVEDAEPAGTATSERVGNRFLRLPEHGETASDAQARHNSVSDVTQAWGVLFFLLTGSAPQELFDDQQRPPHQRLDLRRAIAGAESWQIDRLIRLFDIAFQWLVEARWQSAAQSLQALESVMSEEASRFEDRVRDIVGRHMGNEELQLKRSFYELRPQLQEMWRAIVGQAAAALNGITLNSYFGGGHDPQREREDLKVQMQAHGGPEAHLTVTVERRGGQVAVEATGLYTRSVPLMDSALPTSMREVLEEAFLSAIDFALEQR